MAGSLTELSGSRLHRAFSELRDAELLLRNASFNSSINRSYYAVFHAVRAVNALDCFDSSKHSGVIAHFNQAHVATGDYPKEASRIVQSAFHLRTKSDYDDFFEASREEAAEELQKAALFVRSVADYLAQKGVKAALEEAPPPEQD